MNHEIKGKTPMNKHTARMRAFKGFILFYFDLEKEGPVAIWIWTFLVFFFFGFV